MVKGNIQKIRENLQNDEAALILSAPNRFYLTRFPSSDGAVLITADSAVFLIDSRYYEKAKNTVTGYRVVLCTDLLLQISEMLKEQGTERLYIESDYVSIAQFERLNLKLGVTVSDGTWLSEKLSEMRAEKTESEIKLISAAQALTDETFSYILPRIEAGRTEKQVMLDMEFFMRKSGADAVGFDFVVVSGKNSSLPHGVPTEKVIEKGDFITMDFGAEVGGYRSDMTRTVAVGEVYEKQRLVYDTVLKAQNAALSRAKAGKECADIDKTARDIIKEAGFGNCFGHALGHSVGIEIHETPTLSPRSSATLKSGNVVTVEPGIYIEGEFGVRIEDMVLITETGIMNFTKSPKELIIL